MMNVLQFGVKTKEICGYVACDSLNASTCFLLGLFSNFCHTDYLKGLNMYNNQLNPSYGRDKWMNTQCEFVCLIKHLAS